MTEQNRRAHPVKPLVATREDLLVYRAMWERACYRPADDTETHAALTRLVGDDGVVVRFWGPSTIPFLLEYAIGMENFYFLWHDARADLEALIKTMHERQLEAFAILARDPCDVIILVENTSTFYISPDLYRRHNGPHVRDFVDTMHRVGKVAIIHMCGHVRQLLKQIKGTGLDGIHALTPPPTGDTPWELALDEIGEDLVILGALDPTIFASGPVEQIGPALDAFYTPRLRRVNFILAPFADGIPVPLARFEAVARWMERHGR